MQLKFSYIGLCGKPPLTSLTLQSRSLLTKIVGGIRLRWRTNGFQNCGNSNNYIYFSYTLVHINRCVAVGRLVGAWDETTKFTRRDDRGSGWCLINISLSCCWLGSAIAYIVPSAGWWWVGAARSRASTNAEYNLIYSPNSYQMKPQKGRKRSAPSVVLVHWRFIIIILEYIHIYI